MCEKNPTLSICDSLIDSPKYFPFDQYSKWDICKFRTDLSFCRRFPVKLFKTELKKEKIIPLKSYESSRESNDFVEPVISTENVTKVTKIFTSIKPTTEASTNAVKTEPEIEGSGEDDDEIKLTTASIKKHTLPPTKIPLLQGDQ
uniref:Uncharacterized protein n=1 Tax=Panagrolaimus davidi TaxID=227884 RepID=A0A914QUJ8_9BILA